MVVDLNSLQPRELRAVARTGTTLWGKHASATTHARYMLALPHPKNRRRCSCGCEGRSTHAGLANGLGLMRGCELSVAHWVKTGMFKKMLNQVELGPWETDGPHKSNWDKKYWMVSRKHSGIDGARQFLRHQSTFHRSRFSTESEANQAAAEANKRHQDVTTLALIRPLVEFSDEQVIQSIQRVGRMATSGAIARDVADQNQINGLSAIMVLRRLRRMERDFKVKQVPSTYARQIVWAVEDAPVTTKRRPQTRN